MKSKIIGLVIATILVVGVTSAQESQEEPIEYTASIENIDVAGRAIVVKLSLANRSGYTVAVDSNGIYEETGVSRVTEHSRRKGKIEVKMISLLSAPESNPISDGRYLILNPSESAIFRKKVQLSDPFFLRDREFRLRFYYGQMADITQGAILGWKGIVVSNEVCFRL